MDIEELIDSLRAYAADRHTRPPMEEVLTQAADAIEQLSKLADAIPHVCECCVGCELEKKNGGCDHAFVLSPKRAMQYLIKPRWIPVTEQLPDAECGDFSKNVFVTDGQDVAISSWFNGDDFASYWSYTGIGEVTHWMPLPEPPKEET